MSTAAGQEATLPTRTKPRSRASSVSSNSSASSTAEDPYSPDDGQTWQDANPDTDTLEEGHFKDLFSSAMFPDLTSFLDNLKQQHGFDLTSLVRRLELDFIDTIKLINYLRKQPSVPDVTSKAVFSDDAYLKPSLEDDALLCCLDDLLDPSAFDDTPEQRLADLQAQFDAYKLEVKDVLDRQIDNAANTSTNPSGKPEAGDDGYFESYGTHHIHQDMLQDSARTDAYRDFIYGNKHLFADKVVLDVGCGTGILSMFCAKAGARKVIAVDQSDIAHKARKIVAANKLDQTITVVKCRLEDLVLPDGIDKVDIIVSEWMGYCLLFEAMLDTVLAARDKFLKPDGLIVPSHASLHLAAVEDSSYMADNYTYWRDVYGFDMADMMDGPKNEISLFVPRPDSLVATSADSATPRQPSSSLHVSPPPFEVINLYTATIKDLDLKRHFKLTLNTDVRELDAFLLWFDCQFTTSRDADPLALTNPGDLVLSTGPYAEKVTHWKCGMCIIDRTKDTLSAETATMESSSSSSSSSGALRSSVMDLSKGQVLAGKISVRKADQVEDRRGLKIKISWQVEGSDEEEKGDDGSRRRSEGRRQEWAMYQR